MTQLAYTEMPSPVGRLKLVASEQGLVAILWEQERPNRVPLGAMTEQPDHPILRETRDQLADYFAGKRTDFTVALDPRGTEFQRAVWEALRTIPFGETRSYADVAHQIGRPTATRRSALPMAAIRSLSLPRAIA